MKKLTTEQFIEKAKIIHGDKYDYSLSNYINAKTKLIIMCPIHRDFEQTSDHHLSGQGCSICGGRKKLTTQIFIGKANKMHDNFYDYSKSNYVNSITKIVIICSEHGQFEQIPNSHLNGAGCPKCGGSEKLTTEIFITRANKIHNNFYDYSKSNYINNRTKLIIICPKHKDFLQNPDKHLFGAGCPDCQNKNEQIIANTLSELGILFERQYKLISGKKYKCDFYLLNHNLIIEYNGEQHYTSRWFGYITKNIIKSEMRLFLQQIRDGIIRKYCENNSINLLEIDGRKYTGKKLYNHICKLIKIIEILY